MNIKYIILMGTLISSISYTMESSQTQKDTSTTNSIPTALVPKNYLTPQAIHITGFDTLIPFNGTSKPLFHRLNNRHKNKFGDTLVASLQFERGNCYSQQINHKLKGCARDLNESDMIEIGKGKALYITDMKETTIQQKDGTPLLYGAILLNNATLYDCGYGTKKENIHRVSHIFQGYYLANNPKK